jgi:hypothetical protein
VRGGVVGSPTSVAALSSRRPALATAENNNTAHAGDYTQNNTQISHKTIHKYHKYKQWTKTEIES